MPYVFKHDDDYSSIATKVRPRFHSSDLALMLRRMIEAARIISHVCYRTTNTEDFTHWSLKISGDTFEARQQSEWLDQDCWNSSLPTNRLPLRSNHVGCRDATQPETLSCARLLAVMMMHTSAIARMAICNESDILQFRMYLLSELFELISKLLLKTRHMKIGERDRATLKENLATIYTLAGYEPCVLYMWPMKPVDDLDVHLIHCNVVLKWLQKHNYIIDFEVTHEVYEQMSLYPRLAVIEDVIAIGQGWAHCLLQRLDANPHLLYWE